MQNKPRIDVVLQATGIHGWNFSQGWVNVLKREKLLHRVFRPVAQWQASEPTNDDGLFEYLKNPAADLILLLGFDWHSQPLHSTLKWQERWRQTPIKKIALLQEHYSANIVQTSPTWRQLFTSAIDNTLICADVLICNHEPDVAFIREHHQCKCPIVFQPFAIDREYFHNKLPFIERRNSAFFRGNASKKLDESSDPYRQRQKLIEKIANYPGICLKDIDSNTQTNPLETVKLYTEDLTQYRILLNLPSLSSTLTSRPYEIMGCGGLLLQNKVSGELSNNLFIDWQHLVYYNPDNVDDLLTKVEYLIANPGLTRFIAENGYKLSQAKHTLEARIETIVGWWECGFERSSLEELFRLDELKLTVKNNNSISFNPQGALDSNPPAIVVSAIISTYNSEKFIRGCLQNLVEQTLFQAGKLEIIVIDSNSEQNEGAIVIEFQKKYPNIIYERTPERETLYAAWNRAIVLANGQFITNANTDDRHRNDALEIMANYLDIHPEIALVYPDQLITTIANDNFADTKAEIKWNWPPYSYKQMKLGCCIGSQPMWRKTLHQKYGYFRAEFKCSGDYEFWMRIGSQQERMALIPEILGLYYFNAQGLEHAAPDRAGVECDLICDEYKIPRMYVPQISGTERNFSDLQYQGIVLTTEEKAYLSFVRQKQVKTLPKIVIDGVFFQLYPNTGIERVWQSLLCEWVRSGFAAGRIVVINRNQTAPKIDGIDYRDLRAYDFAATGVDSQILQVVCDEVGADLFISTYYSAPLLTPSISLLHDMIPERIEADLSTPMWREKHYSIIHASRYITVSQSTAKDLLQFYPQISPELVSVAHNGVSSEFFPAASEEIELFKSKYKIDKEYFLVVGSRYSLNGYKNIILFFRAMKKFARRRDVAIVCVGGEPKLEPELAALSKDTTVRLLKLSDSELRSAFSGAIALVYPSLYEGFGLPIAEAMACGCPVITCRNSSIPEVAENAALYVDEYDVDEMLDALSKVQVPQWRERAIEIGLERVKQFSWERMAVKIADVFTLAFEERQDARGSDARSLSIWQEFRQIQSQVQQQSSSEGLWSNKLSRGQLLLPPRTTARAGLLLLPLPQSISQITPFLSLFLGFTLLIWLNQLQKFSLIIGGDLVAIALLLGIVGYYNYIDARQLRMYRILLVAIGLFSILIGVVMSQNGYL